MEQATYSLSAGSQTVYQRENKIMLGIILGVVLCFSIFHLPKAVFVAVTLGLLAVWAFLFIRGKERGAFHFTDLPLLFLLLGTLAYGRAFSRLGIQVGPLPIYVTEIALGAALILLFVFKWKKLPAQWDAPLPRGLAVILAVYFLLGTIYLLLGYKAYGGRAFRDIVFCHYLPFIFITLSLLVKDKDSFRKILPLLSVSAIIVMFAGFGLIFGFFHPDAPIRQFVRDIKMTNFALFAGLIGIFAFSFYGAAKKKMKLLLGFALYMAILMITLYEVRSAWVGIIVALIFLGILLKKEARLLFPVFLLLIVSLFVIDYFDLTVTKNKLASLGEQVKSVSKRNLSSMASANIRWRLDIWGQTLEEVKEFPIFGWGYGAQVDYIIWKKPLSWLRAKGNATGFLPPHNHLMSLLYKMGIFGLLLFITINLWVFLRGIVYIKNCKSDFNRRFLIGSLSALVYWHSMAFFFDILESPPTGIFLWVILGVILALVHVDRAQEQEIMCNTK